MCNIFHLKKQWLIVAQGTHDDGTDSLYHRCYYAHDAAEAWTIFAEQYASCINFYEISVTEVKKNE